MITCEEYEEQISQLIDHELGESSAPILFDHLAECTGCRRFLNTTLRIRSGLLEQGPISAPAQLDEKILGTVPVGRRAARDRLAIPGLLLKKRVSLPVPLAAAVVVLLMLGSILLSSLWLQSQGGGTVYVTTMPAVEVQGYYP